MLPGGRGGSSRPTTRWATASCSPRPRRASRSSRWRASWRASTCSARRWRSSTASLTGRPGGPLLWRRGQGARGARVRRRARPRPGRRASPTPTATRTCRSWRRSGSPRAHQPRAGAGAAARQTGWPILRFAPAAGAGAATTSRARRRALAGDGRRLRQPARRWGCCDRSRRTVVDLAPPSRADLGLALAGIDVDIVAAPSTCGRPRPARLRLQPPEQARRARPREAAARRLHRRGEEGGWPTCPGFGLLLPARRRRVRRPRRPTTGGKAPRARRAEAARRHLAGDRAGGHPLADAARSGRSRRAPSTSRCRRGCRSCRSCIRNVGELMWRGARTIRPGTVQVSGAAADPHHRLAAEDLDEHVAEVRGQFLETLANWPTAGSAAGEGHVAGQPRPAARPPAAPLDWGTATEMNPLETAMWRGRVGRPAAARSTSGCWSCSTPRPDWDRLLAAHEWASRMVPRMRQRVVEPALGARRPALGHRTRLRRHPARPPRPAAGRASMRAAARPRAGVRRRAVRPRPAAVGGAARRGPRRTAGPAYAVKTHHSVTDGLGAVQLMARLHSRTREHDPHRPEPAVPAAGDGASRVGLFAGQVAGAVRSAPIDGAAAGRRARRRAGAAVGDGLTGGGAGGRRRPFRRPERGRPRAARSCWPAAAAAGTSRSLDVPLAELKAGAKAAGGSLNDGLLAAVIGGFRRYHEWYSRARSTGSPSVSRSACATRTTRRAGTASPAPSSPRPWPSATRPPGSPPCGSSCWPPAPPAAPRPTR